MADRELLKLAAKAAGAIWHQHMLTAEWRLNGHTWNPLTDDGDALRLSVKLGLTGIVGVVDKVIWAGEDPYAVTRRAIVQAAAEIGKAMS